MAQAKEKLESVKESVPDQSENKPLLTGQEGLALGSSCGKLYNPLYYRTEERRSKFPFRLVDRYGHPVFIHLPRITWLFHS